ncbi:hypothetical protein MHYP_G00306470 [Metynnis hypsauchen]
MTEGPATVSVSVSPSGEIVEGSLVTLTCYSLSYLTVNYAWFRGTTLIGTSQSYWIYSITDKDSGEYMCKASNTHGDANATLTLSVSYSPKRVMVTRPPGEIFEGRSLTLTCSCEANPPVESYTWFKRSGTVDSQIWTGQSYTIEHISTEDSYKYKCRASNRLGSVFSGSMPLDILYSPKNTSVSVTLTCSANANPPVMYYTWYKEGESEPVSYGQTYNITTKEDIAAFYCKARNRIGHHIAHPVTCIEVCPKGKVAAAGIGGFCGGLAAAILLNILWIR